jgi:hypothetical protein
MRVADLLPPSGAQVKNKRTIHPLSHLPSRREWKWSYLYVVNQLPDYTVSHLRHQYKHKQIYFTQHTFPIMYWCIIPDDGGTERPQRVEIYINECTEFKRCVCLDINRY